ncbi:hypothetical protein [Microvirga solisilvae]|uniref:hypothetical protein n=1 Tax=Microvirga solisilvae TaxID=2919498 RepID=UPI001FB010FB|nr:hypothetical protein [Microvirga solisilvae]
MILAARRFALAVLAMFALTTTAPAQTVTTYGLKVPSSLMGMRYSTAWQIPGPGGKQVLVVGYDGGKSEAVVMIYASGTASQPASEQDLAKAREAFIEIMDEKNNSAMNPKLVRESVAKAPELPVPLLASAHITTEYAGEKNDLHYFVTAIQDRLVGVRVKAPAGPKTEEEARAFAIQAGLALKNM